MKIKQLTPEELPFCFDAASSFFAESKLPGELIFDHWVSQWTAFITQDLGSIFACYVKGKIAGILGGFCVRCSMTADMEGIEAFWYIMPENRGGMGGIKILKAYEAWCKSKGAKRMKMACLTDVNCQAMKDLYERMGYSEIQTSFKKEI